MRTELFFLIGVIAGGLPAATIVILFFSRRNQSTRERLAAREQEAADKSRLLAENEEKLVRVMSRVEELQTAKATLETTLDKERQAAGQQLAIVEKARENLEKTFKALSADALSSNNQSFLQLAKSVLERFQEAARGDLAKRQEAIDHLVSPIKKTLEHFDSRVGDIEKSRVAAYEGLSQQVRNLLETQHQLRSETNNLVKALGTPRVRGRWGEVQLKRVVEMAGMVEYCDFQLQQSAASDEGRLRPDLIIRLPAGKNIVVDAKTPLAACLEAIETSDDDEQEKKMKLHARHVRDHIKTLGQKSYWDQFQPAPEFVVMFLPGETFYNAALQHDPSLLEYGANERVIPATPTTLIPLLKAVAYGWRQEALADNARAISDLGQELYKRVSDLSGHFAELGSRLQRSVESYNRAVGTLESRVLVSARRFHELKAAGVRREISSPPVIEASARTVQAKDTT